MRSLFLVLLLANVLLFVGEFDVVRDVVWRPDRPPIPEQINASQLRIIRDTSALPRGPAMPAPTTPPAAAPQQPG